MAKVEEEVEEEDVSKVENSNKEVEKDDKEVEAKVSQSEELKEDIVRVKMESMGDVPTVKKADKDIVKEIIQDMVRIATQVNEDLLEMEL